MFHTITQTPVQQNIDNRNGNLKVGLKSITYTVGWYNVKKLQQMRHAEYRNNTLIGDASIVEIPPGLYSFDQLKEIFDNVEQVTLDVNEVNGNITLTIDRNYAIDISDDLLEIMGLDDRGTLTTGVYTGDRPINFSGHKILNVHLEQISTTGNMVDGVPSTLLTSIGIGEHSFGDVKTITFDNPAFKKLQNGTIHELNISFKDENNDILNNHDLPIYITLEFRE